MLYELICPFFGALGFGLMFRGRGRLLLPIALGGFLSGLVYFLVSSRWDSLFLCKMLAAAAAAGYSEVCARALKAPAAVFMPAALLPLLPGANLFGAMSSLVVWDSGSFVENSAAAVRSGFGIALGVIAASLAFQAIRGFGGLAGRPRAFSFRRRR